MMTPVNNKAREIGLKMASEEDFDDVETGSSTSMPDDEEEEKVNLANKETTAVFRLRLLVLLVLLLAAVAVSLIVFFTTTKSEQQEYKNQYAGAAKKVVESFIDIVDSKFGAVSSMGVATIAHGVDHTRTWPFVALSSFQQRASTARKNSGSLYIHINPMVTETQKEEWEQFVVSNESLYWIDEGLDYQRDIGLFDFAYDSLPEYYASFNGSDSWAIWSRDQNEAPAIETSPGPYLGYMPTWQSSPVFHDGADVNENLLKSPTTSKGLNASFYSEAVVIGEFISAEPGDIHSSNDQTAMIALMMSTAQNKTVQYDGDPLSQIFLPIFDSFRDNRTSVAIMGAWIHWASYFQHILPLSLKGVYIVLHNTCSGAYTYEINGEDVRPVGPGDLHDSRYDNMKESASFESVENIGDGTKFGLPLSKEHCMVSIDVYPSEVFYDTYNTTAPIILTCAVAVIFIFAVCMFAFYDRLVERRQALVMHKALQTNAIVTSLFPENVRDRLMGQTPGLTDNSKGKEGANNLAQSRRLKGYLDGSQEENGILAAPIADLFPHCTVLFSDISGFTAWSSTRDPAQVFTLLQTLYQAFDKIAKRRKVFKVETIGDSYLAVCGLPEPEPNHALVMIRFAWDCLQKMRHVMRELEVSLGPDTGDLSMRFGLHSGPVTAGVLRGERARFQLFGDTVNTASRMESTGERGRIQISQQTATLVAQADRQYWLTPRKDKVVAKGKGLLATFFVNPTKKRGSSLDSGDAEKQGGEYTTTGSLLGMDNSTPRSVHDRHIEWMVDLLLDDIKKIVHVRRQSGVKESSGPLAFHPPKGTTCMQEVKTVIEMPKFDSKKAAFTAGNYSRVPISPAAVAGLREYVETVASLYHDNPFHNFEHACHVTMSVKKLLKRITTPELSEADLKECKNPDSLAYHLHASTHGITSDPLALLAITFSALIHDVDHRGCSNAQLAKENNEMGNKYSNQSVAEQNSLDIAWEILMRDQFDPLRHALFASQADLLRFRQMIVNVVLATDIFDKELNDLRKNRWERAFCSSGDEQGSGKNTGSTSQLDSNLRATIVIEHIIQASDVSHTMQHWHVYQKWNHALFQEMHHAYREGRMANDPSTFWYQGEIGFFDNYVIPLAKKLKECDVFGVSSDEYLNYALQNRDEWKERGISIVQSMVQDAAAAAAVAGGDDDSNIPEEVSEEEKKHDDDTIPAENRVVEAHIETPPRLLQSATQNCCGLVTTTAAKSRGDAECRSSWM